MKMTPGMMAELEAEDAIDKPGDSAELKKLADLEAAIEMQSRIMQQMLAEIQAGIANKCQYKFTVKRDENKLITEIVAKPVGAT